MEKTTDDRKPLPPPAAAAPAAPAAALDAEVATASQQEAEPKPANPTMWKNLNDMMICAKKGDATKVGDVALGVPCNEIDDSITVPLLKRVCQAIQSKLVETIYNKDALNV